MTPRFFNKLLVIVLLFVGINAVAQPNDAKVGIRIDASHIIVGDAARVFLEVTHNPATSSIQWAPIADSFSKLEVLGKTPIDTLKNGGLVTYKQKLSVTGFDSGMYTVPPFTFTIIPKSGSAYVLNTDSLQLLVQTVAVDTTKNFRGIKGVIGVQYTWRDYIWVIAGVLVFLLLAAFALIYFLRKKKTVPVKEEAPAETLQARAQRLLAELDKEQLWQKGQVKEYYVRLTDIVRGYIEAQFETPALELTTDELMDKAKITPGLLNVAQPLEVMLRMADLAKFAKAQPSPQEHLHSMQLAYELIAATTPVPSQTPPTVTA